MPIFLLATPLLPMVVPVVSSISTAFATLFGIGTGAVVGGVGTYAVVSQGLTPSRAHLESLDEQNRVTAERINKASARVEKLSQRALALKQKVKQATTATTVSVERLHDLSGRIVRTGEKLTSAIAEAKAAGASLSEALPTLKEISTESHIKGITAITMLSELNDLLTVKVDALIQTARDIGRLQHTLDAQTGTITRLGEEVSALREENTAQRETIEKQDEEINRLVTVSQILHKQCGFFREKCMQGSNQTTLQAASVVTTGLASLN